ncbi:hypothetical protein RB195_018624 [Necator americanus]|uniref:Uncharacterized protein n=1 Tax=Necator americanus TaxID=51031 RepID=A0ABR1CBP7_NECAM
MESLGTAIRFVTVNCRTLSSKVQQTVYLGLYDSYVCCLRRSRKYASEIGSSSLSETTLSAAVEEFGATSSRCAFVRQLDRTGRELWILSGNAPRQTAEDNNEGAICVEINALMSKIHSEQVVIVGIDANAKMGLERQSNVLGKCGAQMR